MKTQYRNAGWYPTNAAPYVVNAMGVRYFDGGEVPYQAKVSLQNNEEGGTLYYTIDGTDPADSGVEYTEPFSIPDSGATVRARLFKDNEWSPLEAVALEADIPNDQRYGIRIAEILNAAGNDPADEFIVLTNTLDRAVSLKGLSIWSEKAGQTLVKLAELGAGVEIAAGGTIKLTQPANWIGEAKLKNGEIYVELRDFNGKRIQNVRVNSEAWFPTGEFNDKGKEIHACDKTGRWFIALEFLGDTDGGEVTEATQWAASPAAPAIPLPEDTDTKEDTLALIESEPAITNWLIEVGATAEGLYSITNYTGSTNAIMDCYLLNLDHLVDPPDVEVVIPSFYIGADGKVHIEGKLSVNDIVQDSEHAVNGEIRLYYANTIEELETSESYHEISVQKFPTQDQEFTKGDAARFYRLKIEAE